jgi:hypothetical protein
MKKFPLSYWIQLISGLFALLCIPMIFIADGTGWFGDELFHLPQWIAIFICFVSGVMVQLRGQDKLGRLHKIISNLGLVLSGTFVILVVSCICFLFGPHVIYSIKYRKFDPQLWKQSEKSVARAYIADDLIESNKLIGLKKEEVIELLGEPHSGDLYACSPIPTGASDSDIHYCLNPQRHNFAISGWLMMCLDDDGKVNRCWLYTD